MRELTGKQKRFVEEYLCDLNATQAAIRAGYSAKTAQEQSSRLLSNVMVQAAIQEAMNRRSGTTRLTPEYVIATVRDTIERCRQTRPVLNRKGEPVMVETPNGEVVPAYTFDASNVLKGCELLGRHLVLWKEVGSKDNPLHVNPIQQLLDEVDGTTKDLVTP